jgi:hypothetical protein
MPDLLFDTVIQNVITFLEFMIAILAVLFIIIGGIMYITSVGDEQKTSRAKQTIFAALAGLFVALIAGILRDAITGITEVAGADPFPLGNKIFNVIAYILSFVAVISVAAFVYGGYTYLTSGGNEERLQKGKRIIIYSVVGIVLIMMSATIVNVVVGL